LNESQIAILEQINLLKKMMATNQLMSNEAHQLIEELKAKLPPPLPPDLHAEGPDALPPAK
jgi:hypothetical protein